MAPKKKKAAAKAASTTKKKGSSKASSQAKQDPDVDDLADDLQKSMALSSYGRVDRSQAFDFAVWAFVDPRTGVRYAAIRVELLGSIQASQTSAKYSEDGKSVTVQVKYHRGGALTDPSHLVSIYGEEIKVHPVFLQLQELYRHHVDKAEEEVKTLVIDLPFSCDTSGFYDPILQHDDSYDFGIFPLLKIKWKKVKNAPAPSTKFLSLYCEEAKKFKKEQEAKEKSYFTPPQATAPARSSSNGSLVSDDE